MMRRMSQLATRSLFAAIVLVPFAVAACDQMKKDSADAAVPVAVPTAATATATDTATATATAAPIPTPLATTTATVAPTTTAVPTAKADGGVAPKPDGGAAPTAAPTSTFVIPTAIPGFDAGAWKPPAGFPSTLPTFPPPK